VPLSQRETAGHRIGRVFGTHTLDSSAEEVAVVIVQSIINVDAYLGQCLRELRGGEAFLGMREQSAGQPVVPGHVVVLEQELSTRNE
jgi:hypothetical protein